MNVTANVPAIPRERTQLSHGHQVRGARHELALEMLRGLHGDRNMCGHAGTQTLDHVDPRIFLCYCGKYHQDNSVQNLRIMCFTCNSKKKNTLPSNVEKERETTELRVPILATSTDSYSNKKAFRDQPKFREYFIKQAVSGLAHMKARSLDELVSGGSEIAHCSTTTGYKWASRLTGPEGPFTDETSFIDYRKREYRFLSSEEIIEMWPTHAPCDPERKYMLEAIAIDRMREAELAEAKSRMLVGK